jgi:hypothetical protein
LQNLALARKSIAVEEANTNFRELLRDTMNDNNNSWQVKNYLETLALKDDTLDYFVGRDEATGAASIVVWQTRTIAELTLNYMEVPFMWILWHANSFMAIRGWSRWQNEEKIHIS